jgi:hypothetical protein
MPTLLGGLGARSTARAAPAAFLVSWSLVGSLVGQRFLRLGLPFLVTVVCTDVDAAVLPFQVAQASVGSRQLPPVGTAGPCTLFGLGAGIRVADLGEVVVSG